MQSENQYSWYPNARFYGPNINQSPFQATFNYHLSAENPYQILQEIHVAVTEGRIDYII